MKNRGLFINLIEMPELSNLSIPEKILFLEDLWDSIALDESSIEMPDSHKIELDRRYQKYLNAPGELLSLEELQLKINEGK